MYELKLTEHRGQIVADSRDVARHTFHGGVCHPLSRNGSRTDKAPRAACRGQAAAAEPYGHDTR